MHPVLVLDAIEMACVGSDLSKGEGSHAHVRLIQLRKLAFPGNEAELFAKASSDYIRQLMPRDAFRHVRRASCSILLSIQIYTSVTIV